MVKRIICVGLGGQGVLTVGKLLMEAAVDKNLECTWTCKYGNEMRGGYSECNVIISDEKIASPYADQPDIVFLMKNDGPVVDASIERYEAAMPAGATMITNKNALDQDKTHRDDIKLIEIAGTDIATELGRGSNANLVLLGKLASDCDLFTFDEFEASMCKYFESHGKGKFNEGNKVMLRAGRDA
ncbi:MAG: 2-oxoacid:acceptor oxidoreductase family protein [Clostridiales bacterium]|nr:2-oxoacid:acceptor oxidoreductase family protein [Candidatus Crickella merdequi]